MLFFVRSTFQAEIRDTRVNRPFRSAAFCSPCAGAAKWRKVLKRKLQTAGGDDCVAAHPSPSTLSASREATLWLHQHRIVLNRSMSKMPYMLEPVGA
jgi:hypothetical protein